jgi:hypothetical protein
MSRDGSRRFVRDPDEPVARRAVMPRDAVLTLGERVALGWPTVL